VLNTISDSELDAEYRKRFFLKAGDKVMNSESAAKHLTSMLKDKQAKECFAIMYLTNGNKLIHSEILFEGTLTSAAVYPREVIKKTLEHNAASVIIAHNHPSGRLSASREDMQITNKLKVAFDTIEVSLHDHIICSSEGYLSLADEGLM